MRRAYELQVYDDGCIRGYDITRMSDNATITPGIRPGRDLEPVVEELNRLAEENEKLRGAQDDRTARLQAEIEKLRVQIIQKDAALRGQVSMRWPGVQY